MIENTIPDWLLVDENPGVRYLALRDLAGVAPDDAGLAAARTAAHRAGPIATVLETMQPEGYWELPGTGYHPKYRSIVWALILLAQLGARVEEDERVARACTYLLDHNLTRSGQFSTNAGPGGTVDCLQGNMCWALQELGCADTRLEPAFDWLARSVTGEGVAPNSEKKATPRYYAYKCGPGFACAANYCFPCAWGAVKVLLALARLPAAQRTPMVERAMAQSIDFLFSVEPSTAAWPSGEHGDGKPNSSWWKLGFPVFYITDVLQVAEALCAAGCAHDARLAPLLAWLRAKAGPDGRWNLDYDYAGKTWGDYGQKKAPNPWVTLRALRVLRQAE